MIPPLEINRQALKNLYLHAGGEEGLQEILRAFYQKLSQDLIVGFFFDGKDLNVIADAQKRFLMRAMGATSSYTGKPPAQAHLELAPILPGHFDRRLRILEETLSERGLMPEDIRTWIAFEEAFREGITAAPCQTPRKCDNQKE